jgi:sulfonate transport system substrate-binding protein
MAQRKNYLILLTMVIAIAALGIAWKYFKPSETGGQQTPVRIGWQIPLATQGQIVQVLKRTDILKSRGLAATFVPFSYGGPQSEAALAGQLDVIFVGDQPAMNLLAKGGKWKIVSRLFNTRTAIIVPPNSPIKTVADLQGKTVASPFGSVAHREAILKQQAAGLDADKDVNNINLDILEISNLVQVGGDSSWGTVDAVVVWEPTTSLFESKSLGRIVDFTVTLGVIAVSDEFLKSHPDASADLLVGVFEAWGYFATHTDEVNQWYVDDARLAYSPAVLASAAKVEPNYAATNIQQVNLDLDANAIKSLEVASKWAFERGFTKNAPDIANCVRLDYLKDAAEKKNQSDINFDDVKVIP